MFACGLRQVLRSPHPNFGFAEFGGETPNGDVVALMTTSPLGDVRSPADPGTLTILRSSRGPWSAETRLQLVRLRHALATSIEPYQLDTTPADAVCG